MSKILKKFLIISVLVIAGLLIKNNNVYADVNAYYLGSKDTTKATNYTNAIDKNGKNLEVTLNLSQPLDKMVYYILTYEEYENKTYVGNSNNTNIVEKRQAALYYLIHNYKQNENSFKQKTVNEKLKMLFSSYAGNGNNLENFDSNQKNGAQIIYGLAKAWANNENMNVAANRLKLNYALLSNSEIKYWSSLAAEPVEGSIYNPESEENTLILTLYVPTNNEKAAQNAIKIVDQEIVKEKIQLAREVIKEQLEERAVNSKNLGAYLSSITVYFRDVVRVTDWTPHSNTSSRAGERGKNNYVPEGFLCSDSSKKIVDYYTLLNTLTSSNVSSVRWNQLTRILNDYDPGMGEYNYKDGRDGKYRPCAQYRLWDNVTWNTSNGTISSIDSSVKDSPPKLDRKLDHINVYYASYDSTKSTAWNTYVSRENAQMLIQPVWKDPDPDPTPNEIELEIVKYAENASGNWRDTVAEQKFTIKSLNYSDMTVDGHEKQTLTTNSNGRISVPIIVNTSLSECKLSIQEKYGSGDYAHGTVVPEDNKTELKLKFEINSNNVIDCSKISGPSVNIKVKKKSSNSNVYKVIVEYTNEAEEVILKIRKVDQNGNAITNNTADFSVGFKNGPYKSTESYTKTTSASEGEISLRLGPLLYIRELTTANGNELRWLNDDSGSIRISLKELSAPSGYQKVPAGGITNASNTDAERVYLRVARKSNGEFLIRFVELGDKDITEDDDGDETSSTIANNNIPTDKTNNAYLGTYPGSKAPEGFSVSQSNNTIIITVTNKKNVSGQFNIAKKSTANSSKSLNATFSYTLTTGSTPTTGTIQANGTSSYVSLGQFAQNQSKTLTITETTPPGEETGSIKYTNVGSITYTIKEDSGTLTVTTNGTGNAHYVKSGVSKDATTNVASFTVTVDDPPYMEKAILKIRKESTLNTNGLSGATFKYSITGSNINDINNATLTTDSNGDASADLGTITWDSSAILTFTIQETTAPNSSGIIHYDNNNSSPVSFQLKFDGERLKFSDNSVTQSANNDLIIVTINNNEILAIVCDTPYIQAKVKIVKMDAETDERLNGAKFKLGTNDISITNNGEYSLDLGRIDVANGYTNFSLKETQAPGAGVQHRAGGATTNVDGYRLANIYAHEPIMVGGSTDRVGTLKSILTSIDIYGNVGAGDDSFLAIDVDNNYFLQVVPIMLQIKLKTDGKPDIKLTNVLKKSNPVEKDEYTIEIVDDTIVITVRNKPYIEPKLEIKKLDTYSKSGIKKAQFQVRAVNYFYNTKKVIVAPDTEMHDPNYSYKSKVEHSVPERRAEANEFSLEDDYVTNGNGVISTSYIKGTTTTKGGLGSLDGITGDFGNSDTEERESATYAGAFGISIWETNGPTDYTLDFDDDFNPIENKAWVYLMRDKDGHITYKWIKRQLNASRTGYNNIVEYGQGDEYKPNNYSISINQSTYTVTITCVDTPIITMNLKKYKAESETSKTDLSNTRFRMTEYKGTINNQSEVQGIISNTTSLWQNAYIFNDPYKDKDGNVITNMKSTKSAIFKKEAYTTINEFDGNSDIKFLADKKRVLIKVEEIQKEDHYASLFEPFYIYIEDGKKVVLYKSEQFDRIRLNNITSQNNMSYTEATQTIDTIVSKDQHNTTNGIRHTFMAEAVDITEIWIDVEKIFAGMSQGTGVQGNVKLVITADKLDPISTNSNVVTIGAGQISPNVTGRVAKFKFKKSAISAAANSGSLVAVFTVKETSSAYSSSANQMWAEIPEFTFSVKFDLKNNGYISINNIGQPQSSAYATTISQLSTKQYNGKNYISINPKGDKNASISFSLTNPQVKDFDYGQYKYDQDSNEPMKDILFDITFKSGKGTSYTLKDQLTNEDGELEFGAHIDDAVYNTCVVPGAVEDQEGNILIDTAEDFIIEITEKYNENLRYYKYRKLPVTITCKVILDEDGYYKIDTGNSSSNNVTISHKDQSDGQTTWENLTLGQKNDITGLEKVTVWWDKTPQNETSLGLRIPNKRRWVKLSGNVWEDLPSSGKVSEVNGMYDGNLNNERRLDNVTVKLYKVNTAALGSSYTYTYSFPEYENRIKEYSGSASGNSFNVLGDIIETQTRNGGAYDFVAPMFDGYYYVEFIYNGYKYQHTKYSEWNGNGNLSNATETEGDRNNFNSKLKTISPDQNDPEAVLMDGAINNTQYNELSHSGMDISISAFTGGYGKDKLVVFSGTKDNNLEGKTYSLNGGGENHSNSLEGEVLRPNNLRLDHTYKCIDLGITPRESLRIGLGKYISNIKLKSAKAGTQDQDYINQKDEEDSTDRQAETNAITGGEVVNRQNNDFKNKDTQYNGKYNDSEKIQGDYELGVRIEDEYAYVDGINMTTYITYKIAIYNYSSQIGVKINDIVDYYDKSFHASPTIKDEAGNAISYTEDRATEKSLNTLTHGFYTLHIKPDYDLNPGDTRYIYVTFEMDINNDNVMNNSSGGSSNAVVNNGSNITMNTSYTNKIKINVAEIFSYTSYYVTTGVNFGRAHTYNEHSISKPMDPLVYSNYDFAGLVDAKSTPGNVTKLVETGNDLKPYKPDPHEWDDGIAFIKFIEMRKRDLSGNVWIEDRDTEVEKSVIGDGKKDDDEAIMSEVKVTLMEYETDSAGNLKTNANGYVEHVARIYVDDAVYSYPTPNFIKSDQIKNPANEYTDDDRWIDAPTIITTDKAHPYKFYGIGPGHYYLLFEYPDGQTFKSTVFNGHEGTYNYEYDTLTGKSPDKQEITYGSEQQDFKCDLDNSHNFSDARDVWRNRENPLGGDVKSKTRTYVDSLLNQENSNMSDQSHWNDTGENYSNNGDSYDDYVSPLLSSVNNMQAITGQIVFGFETVPSEAGYNINGGGGNWNIERDFIKENVDLGLVERPKAQLRLSKNIQEVKVVLANHTLLFDAIERTTNAMWVNPEEVDDRYFGNKELDPMGTQDQSEITTGNYFVRNERMIKYTDPVYGELNARYVARNQITVNGSSGRSVGAITLTMDEEVMQGATITIVSKINVKNIGEVDYQDTKFYYKGAEDDPDANIVKTSDISIIDYVGYQGGDDDHVTRNNLSFEQSVNDNDLRNINRWYQLTNTQISSLLKTTPEDVATIANDYYNTRVKYDFVDGGNSQSIVPMLYDDSASSLDAYITLSRVLSANNSTDDLTYNNLAEIVHVRNDVGRRMRYSTVGNQDPKTYPTEIDTDATEFGPTGGPGVKILSPFGEKIKAQSEEIISESNYKLETYLGITIFILSIIAGMIIIYKRK